MFISHISGENHKWSHLGLKFSLCDGLNKFNINSISFIHIYGMTQTLFLLVGVLVNYIFQKFYSCHLHFQMYCLNVFQISFYYLFNIYRICSVTASPFSTLMLVICTFSLIFLNRFSGVYNFIVFLKNTLLVLRILLLNISFLLLCFYFFISIFFGINFLFSNFLKQHLTYVFSPLYLHPTQFNILLSFT